LKNQTEMEQLKKLIFKKDMLNSWLESWDRDKVIKKLKNNHEINILKKLMQNDAESPMSKDEIKKN